MFESVIPVAVGARMRVAAQNLLDALDEQQQALVGGSMDDAGFREWMYLPGERPGLRIDDLTDAQRELVYALLATGMSPSGFETARAIMQLEIPLKAHELSIDHPSWRTRDPLHYYVRILGDPRTDRVWAWRFNGHHLAAHFTMADDVVTGTPQMFGANPRVFTAPDGTVLRTLGSEGDLGIGLATDLSAGQFRQAQIAEEAPWDIASRDDPVVELDLSDRGIRYDELGPAQRGVVDAIVRLHLARCTEPVMARALEEIESAGRDAIRFAWAGPGASIDDTTLIYYSVSGPTFLLEYDRTNGNPNHVHSVWRDLRHDWGSDLLAEHYRAVLQERP
ncbi:DUF3500 domain-containing protein [Amycolatopsis sp. NPDC051372]|uniref:DUF3500 domain-containing protein n=1 Tax=Amycolatopsis sp. NPDC051372 TaxID=3155669 RepID=UPI00341C92E5